MDIAKYIGLFLLKNRFCYIPGMGNLEIKKIPATYDGNVLNPPVYDIFITPSGAIDDSLANFIATNEKISIANASNAIRNFATESKAALQRGTTIVIPSIGHFVDINGKIQFITDANFKFTPTPLPVVKQAPHTIQEEKPEPDQQPLYSGAVTHRRANWGKIIMIAIIAGAVIGAVIAGINFVSKRPSNTPPEATTATPVTTVEPLTDSATMAEPAAQPAETAAPGQLKVILNTYNTKEKAQSRQSKLTSFGNTVEMIEKDSNTFYIVMPIAATADTTRVLDSLRALFNPSGVSIYR